jgi:hypothetical protein
MLMGCWQLEMLAGKQQEGARQLNQYQEGLHTQLR